VSVEKIFFVSGTYPFDLGIYPGVGPEFGAAYGWKVRTIAEMAASHCDVGIVENRLDTADLEHLERFLSRWPNPPFPVFFKISDPEMPLSRHPGVRYILGKRDSPGIHYVSVYEPAGPIREFCDAMRLSRVVHAPYPYDTRRELDRALGGRSRRIFLSGARHHRLYPLRESMFRRRLFNPITRYTTRRLPHPGYPRVGVQLRHRIIRESYVEYAARYTHFFLDPSRYGVELMKYTECAYAGCVPIGAMSFSLAPVVATCFVACQGRARELWRAVRMPVDEIIAMARAYRLSMRVARDPVRLNADVDEQIERVLR
jgi:hypothetical protein